LKFLDVGTGITGFGAYLYWVVGIETLILRSSTKVTISSNTDWSAWTTDIYVPENLISSYKSDTNWSKLNIYDENDNPTGTVRFLKLEGSDYETSIYDNNN
jgi:hypothetical protein